MVLLSTLFLALFLQSQALPFSYPPIPPQSIFTPLNQNIPEKVLQAKEESMVAVRVTIPARREDYHIYRNNFFGCGFVVWPNYVLTNLHLATEYPALWFGTTKFPTVFEISDGRAIFTATLAEFSSQADLALLKVNSPNYNGAVFQAKPAKLEKYTTIQDQNLTNSKMAYQKFYAFAFYTSDPHLFFTAELGPFRAITNSFDEGYVFDFPMGILDGKIQPGFSGGPLWTPEGTVIGIVNSVTNLYTIVVLPETIDIFLELSQNKLGLK